MTKPNTELDAWLAGEDIFAQYDLAPENWVAGFDADRQVVEMKLGPIRRWFLRPGKFNKRFYHRIHPLTIETWPYRWQIKLFDDFCTVDIALDLRFQATLEYVHRNTEKLGRINEHIQELYVSVIEDKIHQELNRLADGRWVQNGLADHEKRIAISVCEVLTQQYIQAEALCKMTVTFADFSDVRLGRDSVYLNVLKHSFEVNEQANQEHLRQQQYAEELALQAKQRELEHAKQLLEMQRQIQLHEAEAQIQLLLDKEQQIVRQREVERRLHAEQAGHEHQLKTIGLEIELQVQQQLESKQRSAELEQLTERLAHQALVEERRILAEIQRRRLARQHWQQADRFDPDQNGDVDDE